MSLWEKGALGCGRTRGQPPPGRGCARRMRGRGAAAPAEPRWEREVSGALRSGGSELLPSRPGEGRGARPGCPGRGGAGGQRGCSVKSRFCPCSGRWSGRSVVRRGSRAQAYRGIFPALGFSAIFASKTFPGAFGRRLEHRSIFKRLA